MNKKFVFTTDNVCKIELNVTINRLIGMLKKNGLSLWKEKNLNIYNGIKVP
jgi:hypothetical protein